MGQDKSGLPPQGKGLENQFCQLPAREKIRGSIPSDEYIEFVLDQFQFLGKPRFRTADGWTPVTAAGMFARITVGDGHNIEIVRMIKHIITDLIPL